MAKANSSKSSKVPVLERTLIKRVNRCISEKRCKLIKNKPTRSGDRRKLTQREIEFGTYFIVYDDGYRERVVERHVDLVELAKRHEVLKDYEALVFPEKD